MKPSRRIRMTSEFQTFFRIIATLILVLLIIGCDRETRSLYRVSFVEVPNPHRRDLAIQGAHQAIEPLVKALLVHHGFRKMESIDGWRNEYGVTVALIDDNKAATKIKIWAFGGRPQRNAVIRVEKDIVNMLRESDFILEIELIATDPWRETDGK